MIVQQDVDLARKWLEDKCHHAHIRATLSRGLSFVEALERAGVSPECIDGSELHQFLTEVADTSAYRKYFVQPEL